ncbi:MAG: tetratricopeptide repeat protein [Alphaproteobacteria bacterium]|nr:tetratricopeptide repeat protein [Alphaproteobacteria bacterium]
MADAATRFQSAVQLVEAGRLADADAICLEILDGAPNDAQALFLRGLIAMQQGDAAGAIALLRSAADFDPDNPALHATLGAFLVGHGEAADALAVLERATALNPNDAVSLRHLARLYRLTGRAADAIGAFELLTSFEPPDISDVLALGMLLQDERGPDAAVIIFDRAVAIAPEDVQVRNHLAACQQLRGRVGEAMAAYRESLVLQPEGNPASVGLFAALQTVCDWRNFDELAVGVDTMTAAAIDAGVSPVEDPFLNITHCADPGQNLAVAQSWSADLGQRVAAWDVVFAHASRDRARIRIGYLSSDFHDHATSHLMLSLFGAHDRTRFAIHAYSCGLDDGSAYRRRIEADCDAFVDFSGIDTISAAHRIHDDGIDILVDLKGYTRQNRLDVAALRPAPVQAAWLGYPGTSGADFFDYIVTDDVVTPPETADTYSEAFAVMPHCYQVNNRDQPIADEPVSREAAGLPADRFVFASFNNTYKLEPVMFGAWMEILRDIPNAVLWLLPNNALAVENLRREAGAAGIAGERLVFADMAPKAQHLKRAALADLTLDTRIYNGHTTTSDMLWAGVPVLTLRGTHFASRVSASLLTAFGLPELVTESLEDYKALACELARSPDRLARVRDSVAERRLTSPLYDTEQFTRDLERAYAEMWRRYKNGEAPKRLAVSELT